MAKRASKKNVSKSNGVYYTILIGVVILLIGFYTVVFSHAILGGGVLLIIGLIVSIFGLSHHSLHLWRRRTGRA